MNTEVAVGFLEELCAELSSALDSIPAGQQLPMVDLLSLYGAKHIHDSVDAFIVLRKSGRDYASRLLVRPVLESMFRISAMECRPEVAYRIARDEFEEERKWIRSIAPGNSSFEDGFRARWDRFSQLYHIHFPDHDMVDAGISAHTLAEWADQKQFYDSHYRLYCHYTHATLRAVTHGLSDLYVEDVRTMCMPTIVGIRAVCRAGGASERIGDLFEEFKRK